MVDGQSKIAESTASRLCRLAKDNTFLLATFAGVCFGLTSGCLLRPLSLSEEAILLISYPGELFMRLLKLMILPFVISCIIVGTATINVRKNGRVAIRTLIYFVATSALNVVLGLALALTLQPGRVSMHGHGSAMETTSRTHLLDGFLDMGRNLVTDNIVQSAFEQTYTEYYDLHMATGNKINSSMHLNNTSNAIRKASRRKLSFRNGTNTLGIIFFCIMFGSVLGSMGPQKAVVIDFFTVIYQVLLKMLMGAIWLTPIGVSSIVCSKVLALEDLLQTLAQLSWFILTVAAGVFLYQGIILQAIYFIFVRKNPYIFYWALGPAIVTAFATASKAVAMPVTLRVMDDKAKVDPRISRFILPVGTINMDGTALFLSVSICFLAQINCIPLSIGDIFTIGLSCTAASMSSATVPSAALVLVVMLCSTINAPPEDVSLLFAVDWFVDRLRTTNNLLGDCYACAVVETLSKKELDDNFDVEENTNCFSDSVSCVADMKIMKDSLQLTVKDSILA